MSSHRHKAINPSRDTDEKESVRVLRRERVRQPVGSSGEAKGVDAERIARFVERLSANKLRVLEQHMHNALACKAPRKGEAMSRAMIAIVYFYKTGVVLTLESIRRNEYSALDKLRNACVGVIE